MAGITSVKARLFVKDVEFATLFVGRWGPCCDQCTLQAFTFEHPLFLHQEDELNVRPSYVMFEKPGQPRHLIAPEFDTFPMKIYGFYYFRRTDLMPRRPREPLRLGLVLFAGLGEIADLWLSPWETFSEILFDMCHFFLEFITDRMMWAGMFVALLLFLFGELVRSWPVADLFSSVSQVCEPGQVCRDVLWMNWTNRTRSLDPCPNSFLNSSRAPVSIDANMSFS